MAQLPMALFASTKVHPMVCAIIYYILMFVYVMMCDCRLSIVSWYLYHDTIIMYSMHNTILSKSAAVYIPLVLSEILFCISIMVQLP